jgi:hypothetical protein
LKNRFLLYETGKVCSGKDFIATIKKDQEKITDLEKQDKYLESLIDKLLGK